MSWFRRRGEASDADRALAEARKLRREAEQRAAELDPMLSRLETYRRENYIAEAVEATLRRRRS